MGTTQLEAKMVARDRMNRPAFRCRHGGFQSSLHAAKAVKSVVYRGEAARDKWLA